MRKSSMWGAAFVVLAACGGGAKSAPPAATPPASAEPSALPAPSAAPPAAGSAEPADAADKGADEGASNAAPAKSADATADNDKKPRQKLYRMTPQGLEVEITGVVFRIKAKAVRRGGGWGVKATVKAKSKDGKSHVLLSPKGGPLALSAKVDRGGKVEQIGDKREGDKLETLDEGKPLELTRTWPPAGTKPIKAGQSLDLQVGLWGLGADADSQRPVRRFFEVKLVAGKGHAKPPAVVSPPASAK